MRNRIWTLAAILVLFTGFAYAATHISVQGKLEDSNGDPATGLVNITVRFYNESTGGTRFWEENETEVSLTDGIFNLVVGDDEAFADPWPSDDYKYVEYAIDGDTSAQRQEITSVQSAASISSSDLTISGAFEASTLNSGQGAYELYAMNQDVESTDAVTFATLDTGQGAYELYAMNQDVETDDAVTFATVDTGQGANEVYDMDQNVLQASDVIFNSVDTPLIQDASAIAMQASGDADDYLQFETTSNTPSLKAIGSTDVDFVVEGSTDYSFNFKSSGSGSFEIEPSDNDIYLRSVGVSTGDIYILNDVSSHHFRFGHETYSPRFYFKAENAPSDITGQISAFNSSYTGSTGLRGKFGLLSTDEIFIAPNDELDDFFEFVFAGNQGQINPVGFYRVDVKAPDQYTGFSLRQEDNGVEDVALTLWSYNNTHAYGSHQRIFATDPLKVMASGDSDDYVQFETSGDVPRIKTIGGNLLYFTSDFTDYAIIHVNDTVTHGTSYPELADIDVSGPLDEMIEGGHPEIFSVGEDGISQKMVIHALVRRIQDLEIRLDELEKAS